MNPSGKQGRSSVLKTGHPETGRDKGLAQTKGLGFLLLLPEAPGYRGSSRANARCRRCRVLVGTGLGWFTTGRGGPGVWLSESWHPHPGGTKTAEKVWRVSDVSQGSENQCSAFGPNRKTLMFSGKISARSKRGQDQFAVFSCLGSAPRSLLWGQAYGTCSPVHEKLRVPFSSAPSQRFLERVNGY